MKVSGVREFRAKSPSWLKEGEPVLLTRHGKVAGLFLPLQDPSHLPDDLRRGLLDKIGAAVWGRMVAQGATEEGILRDFEAFKKRRRRR